MPGHAGVSALTGCLSSLVMKEAEQVFPSADLDGLYLVMSFLTVQRCTPLAGSVG